MTLIAQELFFGQLRPTISHAIQSIHCTFHAQIQDASTIENTTHPLSSMPAAVCPAKVIQTVRDPSYYGLKVEKGYKRPKPTPWVDVSEDEDKGKRRSIKRKGSAINGRHEHVQNGNKYKKRRHSLQNSDAPQSNSPSSFAGPSQTKAGHVGGARPASSLSPKAEAMQEQRRHLPIAKGASL